MRSVAHRLSRATIAVCLVVMAISGYASSQLLDEDSFATLVSRSVEDQDVRSLLSTKAVDVAIDASNADALLADALPEEYSLIASPVLEISKPAIAQAGTSLLGVDAVGASLEAAARSVHRQTAAAIIDTQETNVTINTLPLLVVVADEIAGDVGARAAVGLNLPESATSVDLGSNQSAVWTVVRSLSYVAAIAVLLWVVSMIAFYVSAPTGGRLAATRRLGRTFAVAGICVVLVAWLLLLVVGVVVEVALSPAEELSFAGITLGSSATGGGVAFAEVLLAPLISSGRRTIFTGLAIVAATFILGRGAVASALRQSLRSRQGAPLVEAVRQELPSQVRHVQRGILVALAVLLLVWPQITLRVALTLSLGAASGCVALAVLTGNSSMAVALRRFVGANQITVLDRTERSDRASAVRRSFVFIAVLVAIVWPSYDTDGFVALVFVVSAAFALTYRWELHQADVSAEALERTALQDAGWSLRRKLAVGAIVAGGVGLVAFGGGTNNPADAAALAVAGPAVCNGHGELCDVPVDQVVFAGTHNSMSSSALGWELANHEGAIPAQLDAGIRALLIDVQYWPQGESIVDLELDQAAAEIASRALSIDRAPEDGLWMCHKLCQLGGTPFADFLGDLRAFLETHPDEVLIIVIQDEAPASDIKAAIEDAGIDRFAFAHEPGTPWPTLGQLVQSNERLVFMAENDADPDGWYQLAFDGNVSETGFRYSVVEDFDCGESRGGNDGDFFMINHWVETGLPIPREADQVNASQVLLDRAEKCEDDRGRRPGIIAVNFWERGDLLQVVDQLNGVGG